MKFAQAHALWTSGFATRTLPYDHELDPSEAYFPFHKESFTRVVDGERQGTYSIVFTALAAPLVGIGGLTGLPILPLIGGLFVIAGMLIIGRRLKLSFAASAAAIGMTVFATPLLLYSSQFTAHSIATGLSLLGLAQVSPGGRRRYGTAGILVGVAATVRPEAYCAVAALGLGLFCLPTPSWRDRVCSGAKYLLGALCVLTPFWAFNIATAGAWDPLFDVNSEVAINWGADVITMLVGHIQHEHTFLLVLPIIAVACFGLIPPTAVSWGFRIAVIVVASCVLCDVGFAAQNAAAGEVLVGLFCVTPLAALGLLVGPWNERDRLLWVFAITYILLVVVFERTGSGGLQFGARFLLPALPPLLLLAAVLIEDAVNYLHRQLAKPGRLCLLTPVLALAVLSAFGAQRGLEKALAIAKRGESATKTAMALDGEIIASRVPWHSQVMSPTILMGKHHFLIQGSAIQFLDKAVDLGHKKIIMVADQPLYLPLSNGYVAKTSESFAGWIPLQVVDLVKSVK